MDMNKDTLFRGEFDVVKDLIGSFEDGEASKRMCDKVKKNMTLVFNFQNGKTWDNIVLLIKNSKVSYIVLLIKNFQVIDKNGPPPAGTGIKQLRENIAESKLSYEIMDDSAQAFLKIKIMDNIQKYFYLVRNLIISFTAKIIYEKLQLSGI